jgi:hypothetical protein
VVDPMAQDEVEQVPEPVEEDDLIDPVRPSSRRWRIVLFSVLAGLLLVVTIGWLNRETVADRFIGGQFRSLGVPATYRVETIAGGRQVLTDVVIGDPQRPDLTVERLEVRTVLRFGTPRFARVRLVRPRLYGSYRDGKLSFGSLDPLIFTGSDEPFRLPDMDLAIIDGRGLIETDFGPVGVKAEGSGGLISGFSGIVAASAPKLAIGGCEAEGATLYGKLTTSSAKPTFAGPLRLGALRCEDQHLALGKSGAQLDVTLDALFDGGEGTMSLAAGPLRYGAYSIASTSGKARATYRDDALVAGYEVTSRSMAAPQARLASLTIDGSARSANGFDRLDIQASVDGGGLALGNALDRALADMERAGEDTLVHSVLQQVRTALLRESRGSVLAGNFVLRKTGETVSLVVPQAGVRGGSGETLLSVSRVQFGLGDTGTPLSGNFATGGRGLPKMTGRMERAPGSRLALNIRMPEYRAGDARLALPRLVVMQVPGGAMGFAGEALVSGPLPGGRIERMAVPLDGNWSARSGLSVWRKCFDLRFEAFEVAGLRLARNRVPVCPPRGGAIVRSTPSGIRAVAGIGGLNLVGRIGDSPARIASGAAAVSYPGKMTVRDVKVAIGPAGAVSDFRIGQLDGTLGEKIGGRFAQAEMRLDAVPLDVFDGAGAWRYRDGVLSLSDASLRVEDRRQVDRFEPLIARDAALTLADNVITAEARLREPETLREILRTAIVHDLDTGTGAADLFVDGIYFDEQLQPDTLTYLALGVVANARGELRGTGRIDWNEETVTSTGRFTTDSMDLAAAFGPVTGLSGTVEFTDLLNFVTAPNQQLRIAAINPGIEVNDGILTYELDPDYFLRIGGAKWPFLGGTLTLDPVDMTLGSDETIRYSLVIDGLDAARFLERIEMSNLSASGRFDGVIPLVFDQDGGRIAGGVLQSRPPGGNVSYVGELTYKDLSAMGNFAFDALRSLDYRSMRIELNGSLEGEIITRVSLDGLAQGEGANRNFLTRGIEKLPIKLLVNVRAPFFSLVTSLRSLYDADYLRNPETLGLFDLPVPPGQVIRPATPADEPIQPSDSEDLP